jgi:hypothetical protein
MTDSLTKRSSTLFLKLTLCGMAAVGLFIGISGVPAIAREVTSVPSDLLPLYYLALIGVYAAAIPFFIALYQAFRLLRYVDASTAFSELSVRALRNIKFCGVAVSISYVLALPFLHRFSQINDAPVLVILGLTIISASIVVAVFAAVLQKLVQNAVDIKSENDLTV